MEKTFKESLDEIRAAFKKGDMKEVSKLAGVTPTTVRKALRRERAVELTEAENRVIEICKEYFRDRFNRANRIADDVIKMTNG